MTLQYWILIAAVGTALTARVLKVFPGIPKGALPWVVLAMGCLIAFGKSLYDGASMSDAALAAWVGLPIGLIAVGGHRALKPLLVQLFGDRIAEIVLGRLPEPELKPKKRAPNIITVFVAGLMIFLTGCAPALDMLKGLSRSSQGTQWLASVVDVAVDGANAYFARHPHMDREKEVADALRSVRGLLALYNRVLSAAESVDDGDVVQAKARLIEAYAELRRSMTEYGIQFALPPPGGAETEAPAPFAFELPTTTEVEQRL